MKRNVLLIPHLCLYSKEDFQQDVGHSSDLGQKQSGTPLTKKDQGENWDRVPELMMIKFRESGHPVFRATSPFSRGMLTSTGGGKLSIHFCADGDTIETVFRTIISVNQLSIYGAVSELSEEYGTCRTRTGRPAVAEQSDPFFAPADLLIMTPTPSIEIPTQENVLQKHKERVEKLPQPESDNTSWHNMLTRVLTMCRASGMSWVYVTTRRQINWPERLDSRETPKVDPHRKSQPVTGKVNMEWKSELNLFTKTILTHGSEFLMA